MIYRASDSRYDAMPYRRTGNSGLLLPAVSLGIWYNFGGIDPIANSRDMLRTAFDVGITHIDIANNYGPPPGSAEETFGQIFRQDLAPYRDEMIISSKAGYHMWDGPYGEWGSRKYMIASCDQSLKRTGLDYFDIFYSHRYDPNTPLEETMGALDTIVRSGRALYVGISNYPAEQTRAASQILNDLGTPCLIHQPRYNMFDRWIEDGLLDAVEDEGIGVICFSPLSQGILTNKYLGDIPASARANKNDNFRWGEEGMEARIEKVRKLNDVAQARGQNMAQLAIAWVLRDKRMTSALIGASKSSQIRDIAAGLDNLEFSDEELTQIEWIINS